MVESGRIPYTHFLLSVFGLDFLLTHQIHDGRSVSRLSTIRLRHLVNERGGARWVGGKGCFGVIVISILYKRKNDMFENSNLKPDLQEKSESYLIVHSFHHPLTNA